MRYLIKFSYDGTKFNGYQKQDGLRTIQEEMEECIDILDIPAECFHLCAFNKVQNKTAYRPYKG